MREPPPECWLHPAVEVRTSDIAGRGLFAAAALTAGTVVTRFGGRLVDSATLLALLEGDERLDSIAVGADRHLVLSAGNLSRFVNHACDPNLGWVDDYSLETLVDVAAGTELVSDYATGISDPGFYLRCHCTSYRCRQMVEGTDWRIPQLQQRYAGHWAPHVQQLIEAQKSQA